MLCVQAQVSAQAQLSELSAQLEARSELVHTLQRDVQEQQARSEALEQERSDLQHQLEQQQQGSEEVRQQLADAQEQLAAAERDLAQAKDMVGPTCCARLQLRADMCVPPYITKHLMQSRQGCPYTLSLVMLRYAHTCDCKLVPGTNSLVSEHVCAQATCTEAEAGRRLSDALAALEAAQQQLEQERSTKTDLQEQLAQVSPPKLVARLTWLT